MAETIIHMNDIVKSYQMGHGERLEILHHISLTVEKGEFLAILGPSGSGKSTLMNVIGCMDRFDEGEYLLHGRKIHECKDSELTAIRNQEIGFIFQKYHLIGTYTVMQNIIMPLLLRGMSQREAEKVAQPTIELLGLGERVGHKPNELSGGQQQRVSIARALVGNPSILLADEPTGALDQNTGREVMALFEQLGTMGNTIIMITHDLGIASYAKRVVRIVDGRLYQEEEQAPQMQ